MRFPCARQLFHKSVLFSNNESRRIVMTSAKNQSTSDVSGRETSTDGATFQTQKISPDLSANRKIMPPDIECFTKMRTKLEKDIMETFKFPFYADEQCQPDENEHEIPDATFRANGKFYVFYDVKLFPGLTFRGLKASAGDLNIQTPEVTIEVKIPTIDGYFYTINGNPDEKPVISRGSFKLNYGTAIAKGIFTFFIEEYYLYISDSVIDFEKSKHPTVTFYDHNGDEKTIGDEIGSTVPNVLWPCVTPILYPILRQEMRRVARKVHWHKIVPELPLHEGPLLSRTSKFLTEIVTRMDTKLREIMKDGKIIMPDIETMVVDKNDENIWGTFSATSGWFGIFGNLHLTEYNPLVHMKSENELEFSGTIRVHDYTKDYLGLMHCYDKYSIKSTCHTAEGKIQSLLDARDIYIKITIKRINGESVKEGKIEFINSTDVRNEITGLDDFDWLERHINAWMSGDLRAKGIPTLKKTFEDCLNQVLEEFDAFAYWEAIIPDSDGTEYYTRSPA